MNFKGAPALADRDPTDLLRENAYLKLRNAQLQSDIVDLSAESERLRQLHDRLHGRAAIQTLTARGGGLGHASSKHAEPRDAAASPATGVRDLGAAVDEANLNQGYAPGVTRTPIDYFHVGGYRYTRLEEAIAEAKRQGGGVRGPSAR